MPWSDPALAHDLLLFKVATDLLGRFGGVSRALDLTAYFGGGMHSQPDDVDPRPGETLARLREGLDLAWWDEERPVPARFEAFRRLDATMKARVAAVAVADAPRPVDLGMGHAEALLCHVAAQVVPDLRAAWRPTGKAFFARLTEGALLGLLARDLCQPEEAARLAKERKGAVVDRLERLFAEPPATPTPEQRTAVGAWCPPGMAIPAPCAGGVAAAQGHEEDAAAPAPSDDAPFGEPSDGLPVEPVAAEPTLHGAAPGRMTSPPRPPRAGGFPRGVARSPRRVIRSSRTGSTVRPASARTTRGERWR